MTMAYGLSTYGAFEFLRVSADAAWAGLSGPVWGEADGQRQEKEEISKKADS